MVKQYFDQNIPQQYERQQRQKENNLDLEVLCSGLFVFKKSQTNLMLINSENVQTKLTDSYLTIKEKQYCQQKWFQIFPIIMELKVPSIDLRDNQYPNIIKQIQHVKFSVLRILYLHQNSIDNIEALCLLDCKSLTDFCLDDNHITRINCMHKWSNSQTNWVGISGNHIKQFSALTKASFANEICSYLRLDIKSYSSQNKDYFMNLSQDFTSILKLNPKIIKNIAYERDLRRICQSKLAKMLRKKHSNIYFSYYKEEQQEMR